tara:strand:- start:3998 stop:4891 length:894 start_codon:yes stop_codon:yes gene_type:complete
MIGYFVPTLLLILAIVFVVVLERRNSKEDELFDWRSRFGPMGFEALIATLVLMWFFPGGILLIGPVMLILSALSPAGRLAWAEYKRPRILVSICLILMVVTGGITPTSSPTSPSEWGQPLFTENPNAPFYPAGEQYTWLMLPESGGIDVEIVQSLSLRLPYQYGPLGAESSAFMLASLFNMEQGRLNQAVELLDQQLSAFRLDADEMILEPMLVESTHRYSSTEASVDQVVSIRMYELRSLSIGANEDGLKVGEVLCLGTSNWGGELDVLVIVRPIGHPGLSNDRFAESLAFDWLSS